MAHIYTVLAAVVVSVYVLALLFVSDPSTMTLFPTGDMGYVVLLVGTIFGVFIGEATRWVKNR